MKEPEITSIQRQISGGGAFRKYRGITTGHDRGLGFFIFNELLVMISASLPGMIGEFIRRLGYSFLCAEVGAGVKIGRECSLRRPQYISLREGTVLGDRVSLDVKNHGQGIILGRNVVVGHSTVLSCPGNKIIVGEGVVIGNFCRLGSLKGLKIGKNVRIGDYSYVVGAGHAFDSLEIPIINQSVVCKGANSIGDDVVIGARVTVLDGVEVGSNACILDDSLVNKDVPAGSIVSGVPAKSVRND